MSLLFTQLALAATWSVGPDGDANTLPQALELAVDGDLILVAPGTYIDRVLIEKRVTFQSTDGPEVTILSNGWQESMVKTYVDATLDGFTFTTGHSANRHCVRVAGGMLTLKNSIVTECDAGDGLGGGVRFDVDTTGLIEDTVFSDNRGLADAGTTGRGADIYSRADSLTVRRCTFQGAFVDTGDGASLMANSGTVLVEDSTFTAGVAGDDGGAISVEGLATVNPDGTESDGVSSLVLRRNHFEGNSASDRGGVIFASDVAAWEIVGNTFCSNSSGGRGGAIHLKSMVDAPSNRIAANLFVDNASGDDGGAVFAEAGSLRLEFNHLVGNESVDRGGSVGTRTVEFLTLTHNVVAWTRAGGEAVWVDGPDPLSLGYMGWFENGSDLGGDVMDDPTGVFGDPELMAWRDDGLCGNDDFRPRAGSPLVDAGDPARVDLDGSVADVGAFGGLDANPCLGAPDFDGDGVLACVDGDDTDASVGATQVSEPTGGTSTSGGTSGTPPGGDPTPPLGEGTETDDVVNPGAGVADRRGCSSAGGMGAGPWWAVVVALGGAVRRGRRAR